MKSHLIPFQRYVALCLLTLVTSACTGSQEIRPSTLLVVGYGDNQLGLLATDSLFQVSQDAAPTFLASRTLSGKAQALDVVDRSNRRSQAVVLVERAEDYALEFYDLDTIDPTNFNTDTMFTASREAVVLELDQLTINPNISDAPSALCPHRLQVSRQGRYAAFINDATLCPSQLNSTGLVVLDTQSTPASIVYHRNSSIFPKAFYIDQASDQLFFFSEQAGGAELEQVTLNRLPRNQARKLLTLKGNDNPNSLMALLPHTSNLLVLRNSNYTIIENVFPSNDIKEGTTISSTSGAESFIANAFDFRGKIYINNGTSLTVHNTANNTEKINYSIRGSLASFDFANSLIYFLNNRRVNIFDTLSQQVSPSVSLEILQNPTVATVIQGIVREQ